MDRWLDRRAYVIVAAFIAGAAVAGAVAAIVLLAGDGKSDGTSAVATGTAATAETPTATAGTVPPGTPAGTPAPATAGTPDDALAALIRERFSGTYLGPCTTQLESGTPVANGYCSVELHRSDTIVSFMIGPPLSEGVGEVVITPSADRSRWFADFIPAPPLDAKLAIGQQAVVFGAGDCLRFRGAPSANAEVLTCYPDGTRANVTEGPVDADGTVWWRLEGLGWASAQYLAPATE